MTNLTEAQLTMLKNHADMNGSRYNTKVSSEMLRSLIAELRQLRAERENFDSALEQQMRRGDEYFAQAALKSVTQERLL